MNMKKFLVTLVGAMAISGAANAAVLSSSNVAAHNIVTDYSTGSMIAFDLDVSHLRNTKLTYTIEASDLASPFLSLNALVRNLSGTGFYGFGFTLDGISFANTGSITPTFGAIGSQSQTDSKLGITFSSPEWAELHVGNPFGEAGKIDWQLATAGLNVGDQFSITTEVPEPGNLALMLAGLGAFALVKRRRRQG